MFCLGTAVAFECGNSGEGKCSGGGRAERADRARVRCIRAFGSGHPFDLAVYLPCHKFLRVQCKRAWPQKGCLVFNAHSTDHGRGERSYIGLADLFGVYFPPRDKVFLVPVEAVSPFEGRLRLEPTRNNQSKRIRFATDFEIGKWTEEKLRALST